MQGLRLNAYTVKPEGRGSLAEMVGRQESAIMFGAFSVASFGGEFLEVSRIVARNEHAGRIGLAGMRAPGRKSGGRRQDGEVS